MHDFMETKRKKTNTILMLQNYKLQIKDLRNENANKDGYQPDNTQYTIGCSFNAYTASNISTSFRYFHLNIS